MWVCECKKALKKEKIRLRQTMKTTENVEAKKSFVEKKNNKNNKKWNKTRKKTSWKKQMKSQKPCSCRVRRKNDLKTLAELVYQKNNNTFVLEKPRSLKKLTS